MNEDGFLKCRICGHVEGLEDVPAKCAVEGVCGELCLAIKRTTPQAKKAAECFVWCDIPVAPVEGR